MEAALLALPMVHACTVLVSGEEGEDKFLVAYIVKKEKTTKKEIRGELKRRLPFYMIPAYFVFLQRSGVFVEEGVREMCVGVCLSMQSCVVCL